MCVRARVCLREGEHARVCVCGCERACVWVPCAYACVYMCEGVCEGVRARAHFFEFRMISVKRSYTPLFFSQMLDL